MTHRSREVLQDCEIALAMLEDEQDFHRWRVLWAGSVALVRAVGHVLHKVDSSAPGYAPIINDLFATWKADRKTHAIFWDFIEAERNNILKQYHFNMHPLEEVDVAVVLTLQHPGTGETHQVQDVVPLGENIYRPLLDGYGDGEDARDVYKEAIDWWDHQLSTIEARYAKAQSQ